MGASDRNLRADVAPVTCRRPECGKVFPVTHAGLTFQCRVDGYCTPSCQIAHAARVAMSPVQVSLAKMRK